MSQRYTFIWKCPDLRAGAYGLGQEHRSAIIMREHWDTWGNVWCVTRTQPIKSAQKKDRVEMGINSPDICWKSHSVNSRMSNRSLTGFTIYFREKISQGTAILYSFLANQEELAQHFNRAKSFRSETSYHFSF